MKKKLLLILGSVAVCVSFNLCPDRAVKDQGKQQCPQRANPVLRKMHITGKIVKKTSGYIIQGKTPAEIFRILNPSPKQLDEIVKSGRVVSIQARIVVGDNVDIEKIDGKPYRGETTKR